MPDNHVTITGNATRDPELRFTNTGQATTTFGVAVNRRWQNRQTSEWQEETSFFDVVAWRDLAENIATTVTRGTRVTVAGRLEQRSWESEGQKRSKIEIVADDVAVSLRFATADVQKVERSSNGSGGGQQRQPAPAAAPSGGYDEEPF